jgi:hypothetical protein
VSLDRADAIIEGAASLWGFVYQRVRVLNFPPSLAALCFLKIFRQLPHTPFLRVALLILIHAMATRSRSKPIPENQLDKAGNPVGIKSLIAVFALSVLLPGGSNRLLKSVAPQIAFRFQRVGSSRLLKKSKLSF